jgi:hypothetical protein
MVAAHFDFQSGQSLSGVKTKPLSSLFFERKSELETREHGPNLSTQNFQLFGLCIRSEAGGPGTSKTPHRAYGKRQRPRAISSGVEAPLLISQDLITLGEPRSTV